MEQQLTTLIARLLAHRVLPRSDALARRALLDETFRLELDQRLAAAGLQLVENPYAEHIAVALQPALTEPVFGSGEAWLNNNLGLPRDGVALLVIVWALIILPKRERQVSRVAAGNEGQHDMFGAQKPLETGDTVSVGVSEDALYADFGKQLGGRTRFNANLGRLVNLGFLQRRNRWLVEGPLLDVMIDYSQLAPRIIEGALAEVLSRRGQLSQHLSAQQLQDGPPGLAADSAETDKPHEEQA